MKKVINDKLYNTMTAKMIGSKYHGDGPQDLYFYKETLYKKRIGEYFLHGEGGSKSRYAESIGQNQWRSGERIEPMSYESARAWAEENMDEDDYLAEFVPLREGLEKGRATLSVSLDAVTAEKIRQEAREKGISISALIASKF